jgi:hypothetical protein
MLWRFMSMDRRFWEVLTCCTSFSSIGGVMGLIVYKSLSYQESGKSFYVKFRKKNSQTLFNMCIRMSARSQIKTICDTNLSASFDWCSLVKNSQSHECHQFCSLFS